ncbi:hypothetical protein E4U59_005166 [Claviceps monticola]|nr:hypothetical protein E4U59_005166 [Claviceps monticola]
MLLALAREEVKTRKEQLGYRRYTFSYVSYDPEFLISAFPVRIEQPNVRPDRSDMVIGVTGSNFNVHTHNPVRSHAHIRSRISVRMSV